MPYEEKRSFQERIDDYEQRGISIDPETGLEPVQEPPVKPRAVLVMADYGSSGLWEIDPDHPGAPNRGGIPHELLGLTGAVAANLDAWIDRYWDSDRSPETFDYDAFNRFGREVAVELKLFVGPTIDVYFRPANAEDERVAPEKV